MVIRKMCMEEEICVTVNILCSISVNFFCVFVFLEQWLMVSNP